jgi:hypothetical protein
MNTQRIRRRALAVVVSIATAAGLVALSPTAANAAPVDYAAGKPTSEGTHSGVYGSGNITDGNQASYWESANNAFPQWVQVDLGATQTIENLVLKLPSAWGTRSQTIAIATSTSGTPATLVGATGYSFNPASQNSVTIDIPDTAARYVRLTFTANTGWPAGQLSELQAWGQGVITPPPGGTNLSPGKTLTASSSVFSFVAANANDGNTGTYWESGSGAYPATLSANLGTPATITSVVVKLNPSASWSTRTQTYSIECRAQGASAFTTLAASAGRVFNPASGANTVTTTVSGNCVEVRLVFTANTGAPGAQVAEFEVWGTAAAAPDLTITAISWAPASPIETDALTFPVTVKNQGTGSSTATTVSLTLNDAATGTANVPVLAAGATATVNVSVAARPAGSYTVKATVDPANTQAETSELNNAFTAGSQLVVGPVPSADLIVSSLSWNPSTPTAGQAVTFSVTLKNQGTQASSATAHAVTLSVIGSTGTVLKTITGSVSGVIAAGASSAPLTLSSWTAANGGYTVRAVVAADSAEIAAKQGNNTTDVALFVGRGANMPYTTLEAENGSVGAGGAFVGPNRIVGDLAGEASGRQAAVLNATGEYVQWTTPVATNTLVTRFAMPDSASGGGIDSSLNMYVNGAFYRTLSLSSRFAWLYGDETNPNNNPGTNVRHIYDEASFLLDSTIPAGATIRLQKDAANSAAYYSIDFIDLEVATPIANPNPSRYVVPSGFTQQAVQGALDAARMDTTGNILGVYLPTGTYTNDYKFQVYGKGVQVIGAGPWFTKFIAPAGATNTDIGFNVQSSASGTTFRNFSYFGNYTSRIDGPGKVFDVSNVSNITIDNIWVEHMICMFWASNMDNSTVTNSRIRDTFADGINMTNGSSNNRVANIETRSTGDDSFALFAATDGGGTNQSGNVFENLTSKTTWRAAGLAVYGGQNNTFRNIYIADTLVYSGVTISSLDFGIPMEGFGPATTTFDGITIVRSGGHFWGSQVFPAMWLFSASKIFTAISVKNVDIIDPTYSGIMFQTNYVGGQPQNTFQNTTFQNITISGAQKSGDAFDAKSGIGIWANEMPEPGQGPAVGSASFTNLVFSNNFQNIKNTTTTFTMTQN